MHPPAPGTGSCAPVDVTASAKWFFRALASKAWAARCTPASFVPVTTHTIALSTSFVAAIRPAPAVSVAVVSPLAPSSVSVWPFDAKRAYTPLARGPLSMLVTLGSPCTAVHCPTTTCSASGSAPLPIAATAAGTPSARNRSITVRHGALCAAAHSTRTGSRLPSVPFRNGSGNEPTTAGTSSVWLQSCRSHHTWSPSFTFVAAAPFGASIPLT